MKLRTFVGMKRTTDDYVKRVQLEMYAKHGVKVDTDVIRTILHYFLNNIVILMYQQIPITIRDLFRVYIYPHIKE